MSKSNSSRISWKVDPDGQDRIVILSLSDYRILSHTRYTGRSVEDRIDRGWSKPSAGSDNCSKNQPSLANETCDLIQWKATRPPSGFADSRSRTPRKIIGSIPCDYRSQKHSPNGLRLRDQRRGSPQPISRAQRSAGFQLESHRGCADRTQGGSEV